MTSFVTQPAATGTAAGPAVSRGQREMTGLLGGPAEALAAVRDRAPGVARALETAFDEVLAEPGMERGGRTAGPRACPGPGPAHVAGHRRRPAHRPARHRLRPAGAR